MNLGLPEMIFIFVMALIIFGPKKMPEIGRQIGRALNEFKRASHEFKAQIETEISQLDVEPRQEILPPLHPPAGSVAVGSVVESLPSATPSQHESDPVKSPSDVQGSMNYASPEPVSKAHDA